MVVVSRSPAHLRSQSPGPRAELPWNQPTDCELLWIYCLHFVDLWDAFSWYPCTIADHSFINLFFMTNTSRFPNRSTRESRVPRPSKAANALASLTLEQVLYQIELVDEAQWILGQRQGRSWYTEDGVHLAEAPQIKAIRIPARRS